MTRIILVGLLWSVFFMESIRVIMLRNWHFDILNLEHWRIAWDLWLNSWVISEPKEWAFVLIIISFIPLWFTGWIALSLVSWGKVVWFIITLPWKLFKNFFYKPVKIITTNTGVTPIRRRKSYKEIRPRPLRPNINDRIEVASPAVAPIVIPTVTPISRRGAPRSAPEAEVSPKNFDHALFKFDDNFDDLNFDIDSFDVEPKSTKPEKTPDIESRRSRETNFGHEEPRERDERANDRKERDSRRNDERRGRNEENDRRREDRSERPRPADAESDRRRNDERRNRNEEPDRRRHEERGTKEQRENNKNERLPKEETAATATTVASRQTGGSCLDIIKQKGYEIINRVTIKNTVIDFVGVSDDRICLCMLDREPGDWLADEERFNDEEPLWFSENSHRISPVRKIDLARKQLLSKLEETDFNFDIDAYLIIQIGNIINAEDMFEIWDDMNVNVTRIDRGTPREIRLFARTLPDAEKRISGGKLDKLMKIIRNMG